MNQPKQHPILFATPMVQAILAGNKTQTRRLVKAGFDLSDGFEFHSLKYSQIAGLQAFFKHPEHKGLYGAKFPKGNIGDVLWIKETLYFDTKVSEWGYKADNQVVSGARSENIFKGYKKAIPSIHMPKSAARIFLRITNIRVERLLDISEQDAIAEGIERVGESWFKNYLFEKDDVPMSFLDPVLSYQTLWLSINGEPSTDYNRNPFVWVIDFEYIGL